MNPNNNNHKTYKIAVAIFCTNSSRIKTKTTLQTMINSSKIALKCSSRITIIMALIISLLWRPKVYNKCKTCITKTFRNQMVKRIRISIGLHRILKLRQTTVRSTKSTNSISTRLKLQDKLKDKTNSAVPQSKRTKLTKRIKAKSQTATPNTIVSNSNSNNVPPWQIMSYNNKLPLQIRSSQIFHPTQVRCTSEFLSRI